ncbi:hypothetical protein N8972_01640 [Sulfurospirillum sp.]|nr:hypothetical protein [Sulfurospirillum sp.]
MEQKLIQILKFLTDNNKYNKELQIKFALGSVGHHVEPFEKLVTLLYDTVNTQKAPSMRLLPNFFRGIYEKKDRLNSFHSFVKYLNKGEIDEDMPFKSLYEGLKSHKGLGEKTSALFVKNIYNYHHVFQQDKKRKELKIWDDVPELNKNDKLYLPVDSVIKVIFNTLSPKMNRNNKPKDWTFDDINKYFQSFSNEDVILFDDLWFWGFITQRVEKKQRKLGWNDEKYWMTKELNKDKDTIDDIKEKAEEFIEIIEQSSIYE